MLRFFRQIRQRLLTDNKFSKYLLYAIGEIMLVVIGILIALQVDNWNEERQERIAELNFLSRLREDLKVDNAYFRKRIEEANSSEAAGKIFLKKLFEKQQSLEEAVSLWDLFREFHSSEMLTIQNSTYSEMLYAGRLELITDRELKSLLLEYYRECEKAAKHTTEFNAFTVGEMSNMVDQAPGLYVMPTYLKNTDLEFEEEYGYLNDPSSDAFKKIVHTAEMYISKHHFLNDLYFKELEALSTDLITRLEKVE
ncbi:DUF6090 family protein [Robiginitalea aurantiaca]|uniref:DUF6090 family protein n=1 Tax=Robiginitalea aurantiaca TaxID=3056915 RepID=A0ABT7WGS4_9FLAO|nr:DUF6090 family protein [Robiginitalea aurantiaca]MDM9632125.1 DUF6090 family protein [Robiginitalea aurantiaca]